MDEKIKLVLIEDDDALREEMVFVLEAEGFTVAATGNGEQGLRLIEQQDRLPDVILCDIMLPDMDGYSVLRHLSTSARYANVLFIFITARSDLQQVRYGMTLGADDYVTKPFSHNDLLSAIRTRINKQHLRESHSSSPTINHPGANIDDLSPRESQILGLIIDGLTSKQIATQLSISKRTVDKHRQNILVKLGIRSVAQLISPG